MEKFGSPYYREEHAAWRAELRRFVDTEIAPFVDEWDEAGAFPRELYQKAAGVGLLQLGFPEAYGGVPNSDPFMMIVTADEMARPGCGGVIAGLQSHAIGAPPIAFAGSAEMKARTLPAILSGEKISALAITEPSGGSDVANLRTTAQSDGDDYVIRGSKTFITSGMRADFLTVAVRTGGPGAGGLSLMLVEGDRPGLSRTNLKKMGWWCSDTAAIYFDDVRVPKANLIGGENEAFLIMMQNFNNERLGLSANAIAMAEVATNEAVAYARERETFGRRLIERQAIRHKIVEMTRATRASRAYLEQTAWKMANGGSPIDDICMLKVQATQTMEFCAREAVQILGGAGYMRGVKSERIYREVRVNAIGGGSEEILRDLAARQLGL